MSHPAPPPIADPNRTPLITLYHLISGAFNEDELRTLCFMLDLRYDGLPGQSLDGKIRELVEYCMRHGLFATLISSIQTSRPHLAQTCERIAHTTLLVALATKRTAGMGDNEVNHLNEAQERLYHLLLQALAELPDAARLLTDYRRDPQRWEAPLQAALLQAGQSLNAPILQAVTVLLAVRVSASPSFPTPKRKRQVVGLGQGQSNETPLFFVPPKSLYALVGREKLLRGVKADLFAGRQIALWAFDGLPGVGKTALALALAYDEEVQRHFADGILWAGLGYRADVFAQLGLWASALGIADKTLSEKNSIEQRVLAIRQAIGLRRMLLIIDDAWQVEAAKAFRVGGPNCAQIVTTRLSEVAECFANQTVQHVSELDEKESIALLHALCPRMVEAEPEGIRELIRLVGGLPLALTLIGNNLRLHSRHGQPRRMAAALQRLLAPSERLGLSEVDPPASYYPSLRPGTPTSLRAVFEISEQALSSQARSAWFALAAFPSKPNTFSEEAALAVTQASVEGLDELQDYGLLEPSGPDRYTMHQTLVDYARERSQKDATPRHRLTLFYLAYLKEHKAAYKTLEVEVSNLFAALDVAREEEWSLPFAQGVNALYPYLESRGLYSLAREHLTKAEPLLRAPDAQRLRGETWLNLGRISQRLGDYIEAEDFWRDGLTLANQMGDDDLASAFFTELGIMATDRAEYELAAKHFEAGLTLARQQTNYERTTTLLGNLGRLANFREAYDVAERYLLEARALAQQHGFDDKLAGILTALGSVVYHRGRIHQAESYYRDGLALARQLGSLERMGFLLTNLGALAREQGKVEQA